VTRDVVVVVACVVGLWVVLLGALLVLRPRRVDLRDAKRLVPDVVRLLRDLARDPDVGRGVRVRLAVLAVYLAIPIDLVPDFIPVLGYADDVIAVSIVLRSVVRHAGVTVVERHWRGTPAGLAIVRRLAGV
jgi:uncharacterized membrane protein YkvA (DUF1232 family)